MKLFETETARQIFNVVRLKGPISQTQIAQTTGYSHPTVSNIVKVLLESAWVREESRVAIKKRGRPHVLLNVEPNAAFAIGVDAGGQNLRAGLVNLAGELLSSISEGSYPEKGPEYILQRARKMVSEIIAGSSVDPERIDGIGFGLSGIIDPVEGLCLFCPNLPNWINIPVRDILSEGLEIEVLVDDSVRMMALAEKHYGLGRNVDNLIYIGLGIGIGCAIFIHGQLYRGQKGLAGEFGHITVEESGPLCHCGNSGCLEALASADAVVRRMKEVIQSGVYSSISGKIDDIYQNNDVEAIAKAAEEGDKAAYGILDRTGGYIGIGVATLVNLLNPSMVILGGGVAQAGEVLLIPIKRTVKRRSLGMLSQTVSIQQGRLAEYAGVIGGATAIFDRSFSRQEVLL